VSSIARHHAVDLDGTLANDDEYIPGHIGEPIERMQSDIKNWLSRGDRVTIFTARLKEHPEEEELIGGWLKKHIGQRLQITNEKDPTFTDIHDDRAVAREKNTGIILGADPQTGFSTQGVEKESIFGRSKVPAKSKKQYRFMQMMAHNPERAYKSTGPSSEVAREFIEKTPAKLRSKFSKGLRQRRKKRAY